LKARPAAGPAHALADLEYARLQLLSKSKIIGAVVLGLALLALALGASRIAAAIVLGIGLLLVVVLTVYQFGAIKVGFKRAVLPSVVARIAPGLHYEAEGAIERKAFNSSGLFPAPDRYAGSDLFEGMVGQGNVRFALVDAEEEYTETSTDANGDRQEDEKFRTIFKGMFFVADLKQQVTGKTLLGPPALFERLSGAGIDLHDPAFGKLFKVTSTHEAQARALLTPSLIASFKALHGKIGSFHASFWHDRLFIAVPMSLDTFLPRMLTPLTDPVQIDAVQAKLQSIIAIVEDLDLVIA
jgi:hypothetical protein